MHGTANPATPVRLRARPPAGPSPRNPRPTPSPDGNSRPTNPSPPRRRSRIRHAALWSAGRRLARSLDGDQPEPLPGADAAAETLTPAARREGAAPACWRRPAPRLSRAGRAPRSPPCRAPKSPSGCCRSSCRRATSRSLRRPMAAMPMRGATPAGRHRGTGSTHCLPTRRSSSWATRTIPTGGRSPGLVLARRLARGPSLSSTKPSPTSRPRSASFPLWPAQHDRPALAGQVLWASRPAPWLRRGTAASSRRSAPCSATGRSPARRSPSVPAALSDDAWRRCPRTRSKRKQPPLRALLARTASPSWEAPTSSSSSKPRTLMRSTARWPNAASGRARSPTIRTGSGSDCPATTGMDRLAAALSALR